MDRQQVYALAIPYETDFLSQSRFTQEGLGLLALDVLGSSSLASGLACTPTAPASLAVVIGPGRLYQLTFLDALPYGQLSAGPVVGGLVADTNPNHEVLKQGLLRDPVTLACLAPSTAGISVNYLIEAMFQEVDANSSVLQFFNTAVPSTPLSGPGGNGLPLPTQRVCQVVLQAKAGIAATTGSQVTPTADAGWIGLYVVTVTFGQTAITSGNISVLSGAPFLTKTLPQLAGTPNTYCVDMSGTANTITATPSPALTSYSAGMVLEILPANSNTGAVTATINGLTAGVTRPDGSACAPGDVIANRAFLTIVKSGPSLQMLSWPQTSGFVKTAIGGTLHTFATGDAGASVWRSNSGTPMVDTLPGATGGALPASWQAEIVNTDATALYALKVGAGSTLSGPSVLNGVVVLGPGQKLTVICDGTNYTCYGAPMRAKLTANTTLFVATTGSDTANVGIASSSPFLSGSHAYSWAQQSLDLAGFTLAISLAAGTYTAGVTCSGPLVGQSSVVILSGAGAGSTIISVTSGGCIQVLSNALVQGQSMSMTAVGLGAGCVGTGGSASQGTATFVVGAGLSFGAATLAHFEVSNNGAVVLANGYTITGSAGNHWFCNNAGAINNGNTPITVTLTGTPAFASGFASASALGLINPSSSVTFSGGATGPRYATSSNGTINTNGSGATYLPGSSAGSGSGYF